MHPYERHLLRGYAAAAIAAQDVEGALLRRLTHEASRPNRDLVRWLVRHSDELGCEPPRDLSAEAVDGGTHKIDRATWAAFGPMVAALATGVAPGLSPLQRRLEWLADTLALAPLDRAILGLATRVAEWPSLSRLAKCACESGTPPEINVVALAKLLGEAEEVVERRLRRSEPLRLLGLLEDRRGHDYAASRTVLRIARMRATRPDALRSALLGRTAKPTLAWEDFAHLGEARDIAEKLVRSAMRRHAKGINLLLYGAPGTGKSEFARTLAARLGARASFVGEMDDEAGEPTRGERIAAFVVARALAGRAGRVLLVVDEADDVFTGVDDGDGGKRQGSKVFMNRIVETTDAPTLWITNHPQRLGPAVMRRMSLAICMPEPGRRERRAMLGRIAERRRLRLGPDDLDAVAALDAAPAVLDAGLRVAKLTGGGPAESLFAARSIVTAMQGRAPLPASAASGRFDPALSTADQDLARLADRVAAAPSRALSFCFHGLPGTGKSAYARHLAERLGVDVVERRAADLLSMWVGGTEANIADAFREAADRGAMLILDEADSLLRDRAGAGRSWEVTQVNEMLTRMEAAEHPFACTTNLMGALDPATLRRFLFKVEFRPMGPAEARAAFRAYLGAEPPPALDRLDPLAPGDFAVVARKAAVLGEREPAELLAMLAAEVAAKPGAGRMAVGFTAGGIS